MMLMWWPFQLAVGRGGLDRDAALALELHRVHRRADAVLALHLVDRVDPSGVEEDALGQRRLARVDVGADADVPDLREVDHAAALPAAAIQRDPGSASRGAERDRPESRWAGRLAGYSRPASLTPGEAKRGRGSLLQTQPGFEPGLGRRRASCPRRAARGRPPSRPPRAASTRRPCSSPSTLPGRRAARARQQAPVEQAQLLAAQQRVRAGLRVAAADQAVELARVARPVDARHRVGHETLGRRARLVLRRRSARVPAATAATASTDRLDAERVELLEVEARRRCRCRGSGRRPSGPRSARCRRRRRAGRPSRPTRARPG